MDEKKYNLELSENELGFLIGFLAKEKETMKIALDKTENKMLRGVLCNAFKNLFEIHKKAASFLTEKQAKDLDKAISTLRKLFKNVAI